MKKNLGVFVLVGALLGTACTADSEQELKGSMLAKKASLNMNSTYIAVLGDLQMYTNGNGWHEYYRSTMDWILFQYFDEINFNCILQVGDITNNNYKYQYDLFYKYTVPLAEYIPYIACIGNHDYFRDSYNLIHNRNNTLFSDYTSFNLTDSLIVSRFEEGRMENIIIKNEIAGEPYYIITLEFGVRDEVLMWANEFVKQYKDYKFILMTHEYLTGKGERIDHDSYAESQLRYLTRNSPEQVWQKLVKNNDNIFCVLCGHNGFFTHLLSENASGRLVPQILFNLQYQKNGGDGLVQLWEFPQNSDSVNIRVYNTVLQEWDTRMDVLKIRYKY